MATTPFILSSSSSSLLLDHTSTTLVDGSCRFQYLNHNKHSLLKTYRHTCKHQFVVRAVKDKTKEVPEDITKKYGLEAGLWKIFSSKQEQGPDQKSKSEQAKELLTKYGGAYLATSITLSLISFTLCYALITAGVDVSSLLHKVGIATNETGEKVGTFALAYAAHKAASPIRFPPTVALTPIVASWIGKKDT